MTSSGADPQFSEYSSNTRWILTEAHNILKSNLSCNSYTVGVHIMLFLQRIKQLGGQVAISSFQNALSYTILVALVA